MGEPSPKKFERMKIAASTLGDEEWINKSRQETEDKEFERDIYMVADDMFQQWLEGSKYGTIPFEGIIICKPIRFMYTIHDEATAKFINADFNQIAHGAFVCRKQNLKVTV